MIKPQLAIWLDGRGCRRYRPNESLAGGYRIEHVEHDAIRAVEISVLWHTEGKGDEDLAVHDFRRLSIDKGDWIDPRVPGRFESKLPRSPLTYDGHLLKIRWCVRIRVFLRGGREIVEEAPFVLGDIPPVRKWKRSA